MNIFRYALKNIFRNLFLSISSILTIALLVFFVNILLFVAHSSDEFIGGIKNKIAMTITFNKDYNAESERSHQFLLDAEEKFPGISARYISRHEAWKIFSQRHSDLALIVEDAQENPFPDVVQFSQIPLEKYEEFDKFILSYRDIVRYNEQDMTQKLLDYQSQYQNIIKTVELLRLLNQAVYILIALFLLTVSIIIHMTIRNFIFFMQDEVRIIELVGGRSSFIYGPLAIQGVTYAVFGVGISFFIFWFFYTSGGISILPADIKGIFETFYAQFANSFIFIELLSAFVVGVVSALLASYKYMNSTIQE